MFNTVFDSSVPLNIGLQVIGRIALTLTIIIYLCKTYWDSVKKYIIFIILGLMFFNPIIMFFIFIVFGIMPLAVSSIIYLKKPQEYRIQILNKTSIHSRSNSTGIITSSDSEYKIYAYKWWDSDSKEEVYFEVNKDQYDKLYKNEYVYIKSYRGIFGYQHLYKDKDFLRPDEEANKTIKRPTTGKTSVVNNRKDDNKLKLDSRIVNFDGNVEFKPINSDWKPCEKTTFKGITSFKSKDNSKIFIGLPMDNSIKVKSNTEIEVNPVVKIKKSDMSYVRLYDGNVIYSDAPNDKLRLITLVSNYEIYGNSAIYQIIYSKETKNLEVIVKSGFVNIKFLNSEDNRTPGIGKSYRMVFDEEKETAIDKINLDDYDWD